MKKDAAKWNPAIKRAFYNVSWAFISGRTNVRVNEAGVVPTLEAANRTDDPTQPLPLDAQKIIR